MPLPVGGKVVFVAALLAPLASPGRCGALMPPQTGQLIETLSVLGSSAGDGSRAAAPWRSQEASAYLEWGAGAGITLIASAAVERASLGDEARAFGLEPSAFGVRVGLLEGANGSLAAQILALTPAFPSGLVKLAQAGRGPGSDLRLVYSRSFDLFGLRAFAETQAGLRLTGFEGVSEIRVDATLGARPADKLQLLLQAFGTVTQTPDAIVAVYGRPAYEKIEASAVYDIAARWSAQVGGFATVAGRDARRNRGAVLGLWRRF